MTNRFQNTVASPSAPSALPCQKYKGTEIQAIIMQLLSKTAITNSHLITVMPDCHTFVSYFRVFQMSAIPRVFGQQL